MDKIANSWWMYLLGIVVVIFVLAGSGFFIWKSYQDAKQLNMDKKILRQTIINSAVFTILPSISILIGVVTLSGILGLPLPWIRLTVIGALHYEGAAAQAAFDEFAKLGITEVTKRMENNTVYRLLTKKSSELETCKTCISHYDIVNLYIGDRISKETLKKCYMFNTDKIIEKIEKIKEEVKK